MKLHSYYFVALADDLCQWFKHEGRVERPQVNLNDSHKKALTELQLQLKKAGSFDTLYKLHEKEIQKRDKEVATL